MLQTIPPMCSHSTKVFHQSAYHTLLSTVYLVTCLHTALQSLRGQGPFPSRSPMIPQSLTRCLLLDNVCSNMCKLPPKRHHAWHEWLFYWINTWKNGTHTSLLVSHSFQGFLRDVLHRLMFFRGPSYFVAARQLLWSFPLSTAGSWGSTSVGGILSLLAAQPVVWFHAAISIQVTCLL